MRTYHNNPLTVSNTKSLKYICGNFTFEALNLHHEKSTLEKIVPQGLIRNTNLTGCPGQYAKKWPKRNTNLIGQLKILSGRFSGELRNSKAADITLLKFRFL